MGPNRLLNASSRSAFRLMNAQVAKRLLPNMPDDLFHLYMEPMIREHGWPFYSLDSPTTMPWWQLFDCHPLRTISELLWERHEIQFSMAVFHRYSQQQIRGLVATHTLGTDTLYATIPNTKTRFRQAREFIATTGRMPVPIVLMKDRRTPTIAELRILDGNHRLAAMASFSNAADCSVDCWIGCPR